MYFWVDILHKILNCKWPVLWALEENSQCANTGIRMDRCQSFGQKIRLWFRLKCRGDTGIPASIGSMLWLVLRDLLICFCKVASQPKYYSFSLRVESKYNGFEDIRTSCFSLSPFANFWAKMVFVETRRGELLLYVHGYIHLLCMRVEIMYFVPNTMPDVW